MYLESRTKSDRNEPMTDDRELEQDVDECQCGHCHVRFDESRGGYVCLDCGTLRYKIQLDD